LCPRPGGSGEVSIGLSKAIRVIAHALDGTVATEFALEVLDFGVVAESRNEEGLQWVADDIGVLVRLDWKLC
jgi:hypothetical protein